MTIGKYLKKKRKEIGLSQGEVAKWMGYSTSQFISNIERDMALPSLNSIKLYCEYILDKKETNKLKQMFIKEYKRQVEEAFK